MDLVRDQHGGSSTNPTIKIQVHGVRSICIPDSRLVKMNKPAKLSYYRGAVRCGNQSDDMDACDAVVFQLSESQAAIKYARLISFDHQCVLEVLAHGMGLGALEKFSFLALRPFKTTFQEYIEKGGVDQFGRFTEDFIKLISDIIDALEELHRLGYYCPYLKGDDIAVFKQCDSVCAKLWNFRKWTAEPGDENQMDKDWNRLGYQILLAAPGKNLEVQDLFERICNGQLKGRSILKHSALLTVRKKFDNVIHLDFHVSLNYTDMKNTGPDGLKIEELCVANLSSDLDRRLSWSMPICVTAKSSPNPRQTLRGFIKQLRVVVQHEVQFIPEEMTRELTYNEILDGKKKMDLERHIQNSCSNLFWAIQRLAADLGY